MMKRLLDFLTRLEDTGIFYRLSKPCPDAIMVEVAVPGERWEVEFSTDDIRIEKFISGGTLYSEDEIEVLFRDFSD